MAIAPLFWLMFIAKPFNAKREISMRTVGAICVAIASVACLCTAAMAAETCREGAMGVARTIEVDATGGPWLGEPHGKPDFLQPGEVVLTFDDGPAPGSTDSILATLAAECTKATFFAVGKMAVAHPATLKAVADHGHTIGTHTWSHANMKHLSLARIKAQVEPAFAAAEKAVGGPIAPFFRYPYLSSSKASESYLRSRNIAQVSIDVDTVDWRYRNTATILAKLSAGLARTGRGIILMHDIHKTTANALPEILSFLKTNGYKVVHLTAKQPYVKPPAEVEVARARLRSRSWVTTTRTHRN